MIIKQFVSTLIFFIYYELYPNNLFIFHLYVVYGEEEKYYNLQSASQIVKNYIEMKQNNMIL